MDGVRHPPLRAVPAAHDRAASRRRAAAAHGDAARGRAAVVGDAHRRRVRVLRRRRGEHPHRVPDHVRRRRWCSGSRSCCSPITTADRTAATGSRSLAGLAGLMCSGVGVDDGGHRRHRDAVAPRLADRAAADRAARGRVRPLVAAEPEGSTTPVELQAARSPVQVIKFVVDRRGRRRSAGSRRSRVSDRARRSCWCVGRRSSAIAPRRARRAARPATRSRSRCSSARACSCSSPASCGRVSPRSSRRSRHRPRAGAAEPLRVPRRGDGAARARDRGRRDRAPLAPA